MQAVQITRQKIETAEERDEVKRVGVYFLFCDVGDDATKPPAYIGEAENCLERIFGHHQQKDFWTTAVAITSKTRSFTKAHARRLENDCIRAAREAQRFRLHNTQTPNEPHIPEAMLAELQDNFGTVQTLLSILGFPILHPLPEQGGSSDQHTKLYCRGNGVEATGKYTEDGLVVFEGSTARLDTTASVSDTVKRRHQNLRADGVLEVDATRSSSNNIMHSTRRVQQQTSSLGVQPTGGTSGRIQTVTLLTNWSGSKGNRFVRGIYTSWSPGA